MYRRSEAGRSVPRRLNYRLVKIHRNYTVEEVAALLGVHRNTVRHWTKQGLPTIDDRRPALIHGRELASFIHAKRQKHKRKCQAGQLYCVRCRVPRAPVADAVEYRPVTAESGNLVGICVTCGCTMFRRVNVARLDEIWDESKVLVAQARSHIGKSA